MAQKYIEMQQYLRGFTSLPPKTVVKHVREGRDNATQGIVMVTDARYNEKLVKAGIIKVLLDHLQEPTIPFDESLDLAMPTVWISMRYSISRTPRIFRLI